MEQTIRTLCEIYGPSGREERVMAAIEEMIKPFVDELRYDVMGNLIAKVGSGGKKVMFAAHADEIGLVVSYIDDKGFARVAPVGGINPINLYARRVEFANGTIGVVGVEQRDVAAGKVAWANVFVDVGSASKEEAEKLINVGDFACFKQDAIVQGDFIIAKALDDRIACAAQVEALKKLNKKVKNETYFVFTVQEEVGIRGAKTSSWGIAPDFGFAVDITGWGDTPLCNLANMKLGGGACIKAMDQGIVVAPKIKKLMIDTCEANNIPYQIEVLRGGATDAAAMQYAKAGVPCGVISIATRYVHQPSEMSHLGDFAAAVKLVEKLANADYSSL